MDARTFIEARKADGQRIERLIRAFYSGLPQRRVLIDGGAHLGYHTAFAMRHFETVIAVEASPVTYIEHLRNRIAEITDPAAANVIPVNAALGCRAHQGETVDFFFSESHPGRSTVNTRMWDSWAAGEVSYNHPIRAAVLEIDDLRALFARDRPVIVMELGLKPGNEDIFGETCAGFVELMAAQGYGLYTPWAEPAEDSIRSGYPFWYAFARPQGDALAGHAALLERCYGEQAK